MTVEETRLQQERLGTRPVAAPCAFGLCQHGKNHPGNNVDLTGVAGGVNSAQGGHAWLDSVVGYQYNGGP